MPTVNLSPQGRWGNILMQWLFARAVAHATGSEFTCDEWVGERVFNLPVNRNYGMPPERKNENEILQWMLLPRDKRQDVEFRGYAQMGQCMIYTKRQAREWLRFRPEILASLERIREHHFKNDRIVAHHRKGDFIGYGYPVVSMAAYEKTTAKYFGYDARVDFVSEEKPTPHHDLPDDLSFLPDFYRLICAPTLIRANSSFSWVAALLSEGIVLSPRIDGLLGGVEHDNVRFEVGNHCKLSDLDFCSDLHTNP